MAIKTIAEVIKAIKPLNMQAERILREYALSIVEECAGNFECEMEDRQQDADDKEQVPVLVRSTVLAVKNQIV